MPFVIDLDPVALSLAGVEIRWYGLLLVAAITVAYAVAQREAGRRFLPPATVADGSLWVGLAALAGGRALYVLQNGLGDLGAHPIHILMVWMGGLSFYGGLIAGLGALILFARRRGIPWPVALDVAAPAAALGQGIGHLGCLIGGDSFGIPTDVPWAVIYQNPNAMAPLGVALHPTQAYEALALAGLFAVLWLLRLRFTSAPGSLAAVYLGGLAIIRFLLFFLRDEPATFLGLKTAQWIGVSIFALAVGLWLFSTRGAARSSVKPVSQEAVSP